MGKFHSYIASAAKLIGSYKAGKPFSLHAREFFSSDRKYGSRDRKAISSLCYAYFRLGKACEDLPVADRICYGLFLSENKKNELLHFFHPSLDDKAAWGLQEKMGLLNIRFEDVFPYTGFLSQQLDASQYISSFFSQPKLFIRTRPGRKQQVMDKLSRATIIYKCIGEDCLEIDNSVSVDKIVTINKEAVIQDANSQHVLDFLLDFPAMGEADRKVTAWDCCAASGGKSILLFDRLNGHVQLTVSDIRENILVNLRNRLGQAGININRCFSANLSVSSGLKQAEKFNIIICDVPCSGSGTWSRTPEQLCYFDAGKISHYKSLQQQVVSNTVHHLQQGGLFFYITCSVFSDENEQVISFMLNRFPFLELMKSGYLPGYGMAADTMYVAVLRKNGQPG